MMISWLEPVWSAPRAEHAPGPLRRDTVLVLAVLALAALEGLLRADLVWGPVALSFCVLVAMALPWRRTRPLLVIAVVFVPLIALNVATLAADPGPVGLTTSVVVVLFPYALLRWGSGREALVGLTVLLPAVVLGSAADWTSPAQAAGGLVFFFTPAVLGAAVRGWRVARVRELDQARLRERAQLARELHDSVAHHVSAIIVRAQAGRLLAATRPLAATDALAVIETEAASTLREMRTMVSALRSVREVPFAPQRGVPDILGLAGVDGLVVDVRPTGRLDELGEALGAALFRIAQESVTNARRHARGATRVRVDLTVDDRCVRLTVRDDGQPGPASSSGFGIVGMGERAALLGGTLRAAPDPEGGWVVEAVLPRTVGAVVSA